MEDGFRQSEITKKKNNNSISELCLDNDKCFIYVNVFKSGVIRQIVMKIYFLTKHMVSFQTYVCKN